MKYLKKISLLLAVITFFSSCERETLNPQETNEVNTEITKENLNARSEISLDTGTLYALDPWSDSDNIARYDYNPIDDYIYFDDYAFSTGYGGNYGFDYNTDDGLIYLLASSEDESSTRYLITLNPETEDVSEIEQIISVNGNTKPQDLTFDCNGNLYFVFQSGEINKYNIDTNEMTSFASVEQSGAVGLTYDYDHNRLLFVTSSAPIYLYGIDLCSGDVEGLFTFYTPGDEEEEGEYGDCSAQGIEYIGNNKVISTSTFGCDIIYTVDLSTQQTNLLLSGTGSYSSIKDLMYINENQEVVCDNDTDDDGFLNFEDEVICSNMSDYLYFGDYEFDIENQFLDNGVTMMDEIDALIAEINAQYDGTNEDDLHRDFMRGLSKITYHWTKKRLISRRERSQIINAADDMDIPFYNEYS
jgi:hypothetical protein